MNIRIICNQVLHKSPGMLFVSRFVKKIIGYFHAASSTGQHQKQAQPAKLHDPRPGELEETLIDTGSKVEEQDPSHDNHRRICGTRGDHSTETCPERSKGYVVLCDDAPYKNEAGHKEELYEELLCCYICDSVGEHRTKDCPDNNCDYDPPNGWDLTENRQIDLFPPL